MTGQLTVLGRQELDFFLDEARALAKEAGSPEKIEDAQKRRVTKDWGKNLDGLRRAAGLDGALFGRMVTSDKLARADAAVHVAHAITVHSEHTETDYFAAVDDLLQGGDDPQLGSAHIGTTELTSGLFYGYVVVDVAQLVSNLEGCAAKDWTSADRKLAADVVSALVQLVARVSPGAKKGSTAPYACAHLTLVEAGSGQPRTLANAFLKPVTATTSHPDLVANAYEALASYATDVDQVYGGANRRALAAIGPKDKIAALGSSLSIDAVAKFAAGAVVEHR
jgi:CRISPR system Cascade subunit CasC